MTQLTSVRLVASGVNVTPNSTAIPGLNTLSTLVGSLMAFGLVLALAGFIGSTRGKMGLLVCLVAALLIGGADLLINTFYNLGSNLS